MTDLTVSLRLLLQSRELTRGLQGGSRDIKRFGDDGRKAISQLDATIKNARRNLAGLGIGLAAGSALRDSARLDKSLTQVRQTAGATRAEMRGLREDIFRMARDTGRPLDTLLGGFNNLIAAGLDWRAALATTRAINPASAVTGAGEDVLAGGLSVAASAYGFDLSQPRLAIDLLDQMVVAGRLGNAELEDLAGIFSRVGVNAKAANLAFPETLAFVEGLSKVERNPERLSTLADSTLRLFNNAKYQAAASKATGVGFYNQDGSSRAPLDVLDEIAGKYRKLGTDKARDRFIAGAFQETDLDTQKGLRTLLAGDALKQIAAMTTQIRNASGTVARDLPDAIDNAVDQSSRLKTSLRQAGETFARPVNRALSDLIEFQIDDPRKGGLGLGSGATVATTGALIVGVGALGQLVKSLAGKLPGIGGGISTAAGVAQGKALEQLAGVTPVFVTNFPGASAGGSVVETAAAAAGVAAVAKSGLIARVLGLVGRAPVAAGAALGVAGGAGVLLAGGAGYGLGNAAYRDKLAGTETGDQIGRAIATLLASFGSQAARDALDARNREPDISGTIKIEFDGKTAKLAGAKSTGNVDFDFSSGPIGLGVGQ
ncbi:phage tail tape measure protein [Nevskia ramosa]|uniref:phage tail tape measure protein n=1 Tax=Nevskia ramosa TaxID=64002 RepID=UPI0023542D74|nr:phage tail tape measure protein [Nevskia ramosa]